MEKTYEMSLQQAEIIKLIGLYIPMLDVEYLKECAKDLINQGHGQESIAVLNPSYPQVKNKLMYQQAKALTKLCEYVEALKEVDELKKQVNQAAPVAYYWHLGAFGIWQYHVDDLPEYFGITLNRIDVIVKYIHQLQNLFFALTEEELTIK